MRPFTLSSSLVFLLIAPSALATMACEGPRWAAQPGIALDLRFKVNKNGGKKVGSVDCNRTPGIYYMQWPGKPKVTAQTRIPEDGKVQLSTTEAGKKYTCDHLLELQQVKEVMEKTGGACDQAMAFSQLPGNDANMALQKLSEIRKHTWQPRNLYNVEVEAEKRKGNTVTKGATAINGYVWHYINEIYSYVVENRGKDGFATAAAIDAEIVKQFPNVDAGLPTVTSTWSKYSLLIDLTRRNKMVAAQKQRDNLVKSACQAANSGAGGTSGAGGSVGTRKRAPTLPAKMLRRHRSRLTTIDVTTSTSTSPLYSAGFSSLVARARKSAARSGPNAPPARSCPLGQNQKRIIPRKDVKTAPPPAPKPRKPSQRPAPRPANTKKQVAKRPATRARREVGKPLAQKRTTPKRKPKITPKPTRRPRGKPRQRRRKR